MIAGELTISEIEGQRIVVQGPHKVGCINGGNSLSCVFHPEKHWCYTTSELEQIAAFMRKLEEGDQG